MYEVDSCGGQGVADALASAAHDVKEMGEACIISVAMALDPNVPDCYWVHITYRPDMAKGNFYRRPHGA